MSNNTFTSETHTETGTIDPCRQNQRFLTKSEELAATGSWEHFPEEEKTYWSKGMFRLLDLSPENDAPGYEQLLARIHDDDRPFVEQSYTAGFSEGKNHHITYRIIRPSGTIRHIQDICEHQLGSDGVRERSSGLLQDITELQETREALQQSREEMDRFAHIASHDLQEPLRAISGFLQLLESRYLEQLDDKGKQFIQRSVKACRQMETLIRELLQLARVNTRGAALKNEELNQLFDQAQQRLQGVIEKKEAQVSCAQLPRLAVDGEQITTVFYHLLQNGLQYNESRRPRIEVACRKLEDAYQISFSDNGIGIDPEFHQRIFDVFQRLHTQRQYPGTGMGLTICKRIVERHGGTIQVESEPGGGAVFHLTLPASLP